MATKQAISERLVVLVLLTMCLILFPALGTATCPQKKKQMGTEIVEVKIAGKLVKLGMEYEQTRKLLGVPKWTEPCLFEEQPAIRMIYHRDGNYYILYFLKKADRTVVLKFIDIDGGY